MAAVSPADLGGLAAGAAAGVLSGLFGIGGGIVLVPLLGLLLRLPQQEAQGVTLAVLLLPVGLPAVLAYQRRFPIRWPLVLAMIAGFIPGVAGGALAANRIGEVPLRLLFAAFLAAVAWHSWRGPGARAAEGEPGGSAGWNAWNGLWIGAMGGFLSGLLGIGGGIVMVPLLAGILRLDQREAQGTTLAVMLPPVGLPGVLVYARERGPLPWALMGFVVAGFALGAYLGARLAVRVPSERLSRAFAVFVLGVGVALAATALRR
jgi:uncharacterized membrane protein YfcA